MEWLMNFHIRFHFELCSGFACLSGFFYIDKGYFYLPDLLLHDLPQKAKKNHFTSQTYAEKKEYILKNNNQPLHTTMYNRTISILNK